MSDWYHDEDLGDGRNCDVCGDALQAANVRRGGHICPTCNYLNIKLMSEARQLRDSGTLSLLLAFAEFETYMSRDARLARQDALHQQAIARYMSDPSERRADRKARLRSFLIEVDSLQPLVSDTSEEV